MQDLLMQTDITTAKKVCPLLLDTQMQTQSHGFKRFSVKLCLFCFWAWQPYSLTMWHRVATEFYSKKGHESQKMVTEF